MRLCSTWARKRWARHRTVRMAGPFPRRRRWRPRRHPFIRRWRAPGYRGPYLKALATSVAKGRVDLEALAATSRGDLPDDEVATQLQALPGVGPYAAAHIMLMLARYDRLILDSWTRPTYARLLGRKRPVSDRAIERRFKRYGPYAGLAFWLFLT